MKLNIGQKKLGLALDRRSSLVSVRSSTREGTTTLPQKGKLKLKKKKKKAGEERLCNVHWLIQLIKLNTD